MTHNDYLWDRSGPADPDVARFEHLLGTLRSTAPEPRWPLGAHEPWGRTSVLPERRSFRTTPRFLAAAAALVLGCGAALWRPPSTHGPSWPVVRLEGMPVAGTTPVGDAARLAVGEWLETDAGSRATLAISTIGRLDVDPRTRLRIVETREGAHRLAMTRGRVHAFIWAPPGQFVVDTPSSRAIDLGCAYTLEVHPDGSGLIEVTAGWVAFEHAGRESFIPAGARCATRTGVGPGTPMMDDAPAALGDAMATLDFGSPSGEEHAAALGQVLAAARREDAITVWHLLSRVPPEERDAVYDALARLVPPPAIVTRDGVRRGDKAMRDAWWEALDLGGADWWRSWKRRWP